MLPKIDIKLIVKSLLQYKLKNLSRRLSLRSKQNTSHNYSRRIASISLHFGKLPEKIDDDVINAKRHVILNRSKLKELFATPQMLKHRIVLTLVYSAGLRWQEVINLKISDIDFDQCCMEKNRG